MRIVTISFFAVCSTSLFGQSLRILADERGIRFGAAVAPVHFGEAAYAETLAREFNQVEPENAMKFGPIHPGPKEYNFSPADFIVEFAEAHHMAVRGHTLVWHNQVPSWVKNGNFTTAQLSSILEEHIKTVVGRYAGKVYAWDVVNEAFEADGSARKTIWSDTPGYIEQAFRWAHEADPRALLFYNEYSAEGMNRKCDAIFQMVQDFEARGMPTSVQTWGFTDKYSWIPGTYPGFGAALEFDASYRPKPDYSSTQNALESSAPVAAAAGLVNAASYVGGAVAPGEVVLLYGATFGHAGLQFAQLDTSGGLPGSWRGHGCYSMECRRRCSIPR